MTVEVDKEADALYIRLADSSIEETSELNDDVFADVDAKGNVVGYEIINLSVYTTLELPMAHDVPTRIEDIKTFAPQ